MLGSSKLRWLVGVIVAAVVAVGILIAIKHSLGAAQKFPAVPFGVAAEVTGTLTKYNDQYVVTGDAKYTHGGAYIMNSQAPLLEPLLKSALGKSVHLFGSVPEDGNDTLFVLWMDGKSLVGESGDLPSNPIPSFKTVFNTFTSTQQECVTKAFDTATFQQLMDPKTTQPTEDQIKLINDCLLKG